MLEAGRRLAEAQGALSVAHSTDTALAAAREEAAASHEQYQVRFRSRHKMPKMLTVYGGRIKELVSRDLIKAFVCMQWILKNSHRDHQARAFEGNQVS